MFHGGRGRATSRPVPSNVTGTGLTDTRIWGTPLLNQGDGAGQNLSLQFNLSMLLFFYCKSTTPTFLKRLLGVSALKQMASQLRRLLVVAVQVS